MLLRSGRLARNSDVSEQLWIFSYFILIDSAINYAQAEYIFLRKHVRGTYRGNGQCLGLGLDTD